MQEIRRRHPFFGGAALLLYLLMIFFSHSQHDHGSGIFFKEFGIKSPAKTFQLSDGKAADAGCVSCHMLYDGHAPSLESPQFDFSRPSLFQREILAYRQRFSSLPIRAFHLRGPPAA